MSEDTEGKRPQFGARFLPDEESVLKHNCWDNVEWDPELLQAAQEKIQQQSEKKICAEVKEHLQKDTGNRWDKFYDCHQNRFFKDRHWLFTEFPELGGLQKLGIPERVFPGIENSTPVVDTKNNENLKTEKQSESELKQNECEEYQVPSELIINNRNSCSCGDASTSNQDVQSITNTSGTCIEALAVSDGENKESSSVGTKPNHKYILEIGCGVGNTIFPILEYNIDPNIFVYGCDFSKNAIEILKSNPDYDPKRCHAFVCDITESIWETPFSKNSLDITTLIFVLSAIHPEKMQHVVRQVYDHLKPGGLLLFRDYGRYDMAQLRFKAGQMMEDNFYVRSDGTFVYFFTQDEVTKLFTEAGFQEEMIYTDRRLQVNRLRQLKMYRVWVQAKYRKPLSS